VTYPTTVACRTLLATAFTWLLAGCASSPVNKPLHAEGEAQVGWAEQTDTDGSVIIIVATDGSVPYAKIIQTAEERAKQRCTYGYHVMNVDGGDLPQLDADTPRFIIGSELRFKVHCFENDKK
jgi:hypothetical protein